MDTALVLIADISQTMDAGERAIQRVGYSEAFKHPDIVNLISCGKLQVTYIEFASKPYVVVPWTTLTDTESALSFSSAIANGYRPNVSGDNSGATNIGAAMELGEQLLDGIVAERYVMDVSADGVDNYGVSPIHSRNRLITPTPENNHREVTINGLLIGPEVLSYGPPGSKPYDYLQEHFDTKIIGGPASFSIRAKSASQLPEIVRRKLIIEMM